MSLYSATMRLRCGSPLGGTLGSGGLDRLRLRETPQTGWFIEGLKEFLVRSPEEALALMAAGERRKHIAESKHPMFYRAHADVVP